MILSKEDQDKRVVVFNLLKDQMNMTAMIELGYYRDEISVLFQKLQQASFGQHVLGKRGRNGVEKFVPNDLCPDTFEVIFDKRPTRGKVEAEIKEGPTDGIIFSKFLTMKRKLSYIPSTGQPGYVVSFSICGNYILLDRIADGGFESIEKATDNIWEQIKDNAPVYASKNMTPTEQVASILRGKGFIQLR